ncbi:hypothetical protein H2248_005596 [Termitomyces sp. 'cryptogamus']|nr:hypothetical protein H2248_005584 [Termitomyces sp. 'cryptogamus']KAH0578057.1 hypothetical protein H2248_005596 [Termitomyces sp. 'cryptogamus']
MAFVMPETEETDDRMNFVEDEKEGDRETLVVSVVEEGGRGSHAGCFAPRIHIRSVHLSGIASVRGALASTLRLGDVPGGTLLVELIK